MVKNNLWIGIRIVGILIVFFVCASATFGQEPVKADSTSTIPVELNQILKTSCMTCHSDAGRDKPKNAVNFSLWEKYTPTEKMMLASSIQTEVTKKSMPPKGFLNSHPDAALNDLQISQIVQWCDALKAK